ncbi:MAG: 4-hydroxy-tetrahydrodipicolinate reductase [Chitinophagales bacterium]|nr:4-hydroxy-tetrahydrodipicolinate reductase [Chitinophagales bacterium]
MKIALLGYGKMGKMIEKCATGNREYSISLKINTANRHSISKEQLQQADVVIEFSSPDAVIENINWCLEAGMPMVIGTTGWYDDLENVKRWCREKKGAIVYASNFSIGVNIMFELNRKLAQLMRSKQEYDVSLEEVHHVHKKDAPSGTAITLANDLLKESTVKKSWLSIRDNDSAAKNHNPSELIILSRREDAVVGTHTVEYGSSADRISIRHEAFSREGFAKGALAAANWIRDKKGIFEFSEILKEI